MARIASVKILFLKATILCSVVFPTSNLYSQDNFGNLPQHQRTTASHVHDSSTGLCLQRDAVSDELSTVNSVDCGSIIHSDTVVNDITPPEIVSFEISLDEVDVSQENQLVTIDMEIVESESAVSNSTVLIRLLHPTIEDYYQNSNAVLISGDRNRGIWQAELTVPSGGQAGNWPVRVFPLSNSHGARGEDNPGASANASLLVTNTSPTSVPPSVTSFEISSRELDVSEQRQRLEVLIDIEDDIEIVKPAVTIGKPPNAYRHSMQVDLREGDKISGKWRAFIFLPEGFSSGLWKVFVNPIANVAGVKSEANPGASSDNEFTIINDNGPRDSEAPEIQSLEYSPQEIDVTHTNQEVTISMRITDNQSGVEGPISISTEFHNRYFFANAQAFLTEGDENDGIWQTTIDLPQGLVSGVYTFNIFRVEDREGNFIWGPDLDFVVNNDNLKASGVRFDFDGDDKADIALRRPGSGQFYLRSSDGQIVRNFSGNQVTDIPVSGIFDNSRLSDFGVYRRGPGVNWLVGPRGSFGNQPNDIPIPADFDGDGITDIAVRRPESGRFILLLSASPIGQNIRRLYFGAEETDVPIPFDFDGDGIDDLAIRRPTTRQFIIKHSSTGQIERIRFGSEENDIAVPADYDGDGIDDIAVWRPNSGDWYIRYSSNLETFTTRFGEETSDIPMPADYDGDGKADLAFRRPRDGNIYIAESGTSNQIKQYYFGSQETDLPFAAPIEIRMRVTDSTLYDTILSPYETTFPTDVVIEKLGMLEFIPAEYN